METLRKQFEIVKGQRAVLAARVEELLERNEMQLRSSRKQIDGLRARQQELEEQIVAGQVEGNGVRRRLELATRRLATATEREAELSHDANALRLELLEAKATARRMSDDAEAAALELDEYRALTKGRQPRDPAEPEPEPPPHDGALTRELDTRTTERDGAERRVAALEAEAGELRGRVELLQAALEESRLEHRAIATDLVRTQSTLQARSEQLQRLLESRWYRLARASWRARRQRPPLVAMLTALLAIATAVGSLLLAAGAGALVAGLLVAALLLATAVASAVVVPAWRDRRIPRMAASGSYAHPMSVDVEALREQLAGTPQPVPSPAQGSPRPPTVEPATERAGWLRSSRVPELGKLRVAGILDEMSRASFAPECDLDTGFTTHDWRERLEERPPHLLLVESAWAGNDGGWQYAVGSYDHPRFAGLPALCELVDWCRERDIPTVFWNKEDPVHYERFKEAAALFDHVFTTDSGRIPAYHELGGTIRTVEALPFAAQPRIHNPIPIVEDRRAEPVFAGTYYRDRHHDRQRDLDYILDAARPRGLVIYDRMFGSDGDAYGFPERFLPHVRGRLSYAQTVAAYKSHRVFLNVNSVAASPTMFSRRVFELLACGTAVLSTASSGMEAMFGELVPIAHSQEEAEVALARLLDDDAYRRDLTTRAQRLVLTRHTYRDRLLTVAQSAGFDFSETSGAETTALVIADKRDELEQLAHSLLAQSAAPDEVIVGLCGNLVADDVDELARRFGGRLRTAAQTPGLSNSERLQELAAMAATPWVAPLRPSGRYDAEHLRDLVACVGFADAQVIGFGSAGAGGRLVHRYEEAVSPDAAIAVRDIVASRGWPEDRVEMRRWFAQGVRIYAGDPRRA